MALLRARLHRLTTIPARGPARISNNECTSQGQCTYHHKIDVLAGCADISQWSGKIDRRILTGREFLIEEKAIGLQ